MDATNSSTMPVSTIPTFEDYIREKEKIDAYLANIKNTEIKTDINTAPINTTPATNPVAADKESLMQQYRQNLMDKIMKSQDNLSTASKEYEESQKAGSGLGGGLAKGLGVFADTMAGMAGQKGNYTQGVVGEYKEQKKAGAEKYKTALGQEQSYLDNLEKMDTKEMDAFKIKNLRESTDPNSKESVSARLFAKDQLGITLPETTNAIQAKTYIEQAMKAKEFKNSEEWRKKNYDQRQESIDTAKTNKLEEKNLPKNAFDKLEPDKKMVLEGIARKTADITIVRNQIDAAVKQLKNPNASEEMRIQVGRQLLKTLNSPMGADAVGAEEAKRLGGYLEYTFDPATKGINPLNWGPNLDKFIEQSEITKNQLDSAIQANEVLKDKYFQEAGIPRTGKSSLSSGTSGSPWTRFGGK